jgi:putative transposase
MPRHPRLFVAGVPVHIVQRGHDRQPVFVESEDFCFYLTNLVEAKTELSIRLLAYCLMTNHVHLVVVPGERARDVSNLMRIVAARQTRRVNKLENRSGTLWEGRYKASLIDTERYLLACYRYVDLNPVRAAMVTAPGDYPWSSYRAHAALEPDAAVDAHTVYLALGQSEAERGCAYRRFVAQAVDDAELSLIREATQRNQLTGGSRFQRAIEERTGRRVSTLGQGRPRKSKVRGSNEN